MSIFPASFHINRYCRVRNPLTDAKPVDDNGCDLEGTIRDYARNVFGNANERFQKAWNWLKRKTHEGVTAARRGLQNLEHQMADPAENELTP
ncbi:unnamed protein product [Allacma fusca]|uniref:Uncharacterized protein n=1 Tax=Allacma fusca TaxID=39272 RepID=A0A8J2LE03_9HEXA|nr:unnamed protein product [Allacma fusca]